MARARQRGAAGLVLAGAVVLLALGAGTVAVLRQARLSTLDAQDAGEKLRLARDQVYAFAAHHGRFPCPATTPGGAEDCSASGKGKGYLPVQTLWASSASSVGDAFRSARYGAYRGTVDDVYDPDLTQAGSYYTPNGGIVPLSPDYDVEPGDAAHSGPIKNSWDLCHALGRMARPAADSGDMNWVARWGRGVVPGSVAAGLAKPGLDTRTGFEAADKRFTGVRNVAFAISVPDPLAVGKSRSGRNADDTPLFEDPDRAHDVNYHDQVLVASVDEAYRHAQCGVGLMAVDHLEQVRVHAEVAQTHVNSYQDDHLMRRHLAAIDMATAAADVQFALAEDFLYAQLVIEAAAVGAANPIAPAQAPLMLPLVVAATAAAAGELAEAVNYWKDVERELAPVYAFTPWTPAQGAGATSGLNRWLRTVDRAGATVAELPPASSGTY